MNKEKEKILENLQTLEIELLKMVEDIEYFRDIAKDFLLRMEGVTNDKIPNRKGT